MERLPRSPEPGIDVKNCILVVNFKASLEDVARDVRFLTT